MVIQRLSIRAFRGKLQIVPIWQILAKSGAKVCRWTVSVDRRTGVESMTVDIAAAGPQCAADIIAMLSKEPLNMMVTPLPAAVVSDHGALV